MGGEYDSEYEHCNAEDDKHGDSDEMGYSDDEEQNIEYRNRINEDDQGGIQYSDDEEEYVNVRRRDSGNENHDKENEVEHVEHEEANKNDLTSNIDREVS